MYSEFWSHFVNFVHVIEFVLKPVQIYSNATNTRAAHDSMAHLYFSLVKTCFRTSDRSETLKVVET